MSCSRNEQVEHSFDGRGGGCPLSGEVGEAGDQFNIRFAIGEGGCPESGAVRLGVDGVPVQNSSFQDVIVGGSGRVQGSVGLLSFAGQLRCELQTPRRSGSRVRDH